MYQGGKTAGSNIFLLYTAMQDQHRQAMLQNISGSLPPTRNQLYYNQQLHEGSMGRLSQDQELIRYLKRGESGIWSERNVALYHDEVTELSLHAISKYDLRCVANSVQQ